jgi:hypothetical protein
MLHLNYFPCSVVQNIEKPRIKNEKRHITLYLQKAGLNI